MRVGIRDIVTTDFQPDDYYDPSKHHEDLEVGEHTWERWKLIINEYESMQDEIANLIKEKDNGQYQD